MKRMDILSFQAGAGSAVEEAFRKAGFAVPFAQEDNDGLREEYEESHEGTYAYGGPVSAVDLAVAGVGFACGVLVQAPVKRGKRFYKDAGKALAACRPAFFLVYGMDRVRPSDIRCAEGYTLTEHEDKAAGMRMCLGISEADRDLSGIPAQALKGQQTAHALALLLSHALSGKKGAPAPPGKTVSRKAPEKGPAEAEPEGDPGEGKDSIPASYKGHTFTAAERKKLASGLAVYIDTAKFKGDVVYITMPGRAPRLYPMPSVPAGKGGRR